MNAFVRNCDRIREETIAGTHVAIVHHGGWDSSHARGSIALIGAADLVVKISGEKGGAKTAFVEYAKDDESGYGLGFELEAVNLPDDAKGRPRSTCLAVECESPAPASEKRRKKLADDAVSLLRHIQDEIAAGHGTNTRPIAGMPLVPTLSRSVLHAALVGRDWLQTPPELSDQQGSQRKVPDAEWKRLNKRLTVLQNHRLIGFDRERVWLAKPAATL
jgi:hypothetical protein